MRPRISQHDSLSHSAYPYQWCVIFIPRDRTKKPQYAKLLGNGTTSRWTRSETASNSSAQGAPKAANWNPRSPQLLRNGKTSSWIKSKTARNSPEHKTPQTEDANLNCIKTLRKRYQCDVGYSGHEVGLAVSYAAVVFGITSLERHITLDRAMYGSDQAASVETAGFIQLVGAVRKIEKAMG